MERKWWDSTAFFALMVLASMAPLIVADVLPLVDLPGHLARYRVALDLDTSEYLQRYFAFRWILSGNLGIDLLIIPFSALGLEFGLKLLVTSIPAFATIGIFWTAREVHGRVPPTAIFAIPFLYGYPFNYGFLNFSLSMALALIALAFWIRLGRLDRDALRTILFVPISCLIWLAHAFGWGVLVLTAWSAELIREHDAGRSWTKAFFGASLRTAALAPPLALMILWRSGAAGGETTGFFTFIPKIFALLAALRDNWLLWDSLGVAVALVLIGAARSDKRLEFSRKLAVPAAVLAITFLVMPGQIFGSAFADMRLAPYMLIFAILAIRFRREDDYAAMRTMAMLGLVFVAARLVGNSVSFGMAGGELREQLRALDHVPKGAAVLSLVGDTCNETWRMPYHGHIGSYVIVRREGFSNDQWRLAGAQMMTVKYYAAKNFALDPSQFVYSHACLKRTRRKLEKGERLGRTVEQAMSEFPRSAFDYVWLVRVPDFDMSQRPGLVPIWRGRRSVLYKVDAPSPDRS